MRCASCHMLKCIYCLYKGPQRRDVERNGDTETIPGTSTETASAVTGISKIAGLTKILRM